MNHKRYELLDTIRGMVLISMIIYHACWNLVYIYGVDWGWYRSKGAYIWQQSICWTFILLSGFCFSLGKRHLKSGLKVFLGGCLVTIVTMVFMPQNRVVFGVLTCIGSCILFMNFTEKIWKSISAGLGLALSFSLFLFAKNMNSGYLGFGSMRWIELPEKWYCNMASTFWGFPYKEFYSTDYFSFIPWWFLFLSGFYVYQIMKKYHLLEGSFFEKELPFFSFLGKHSLLIYLLHQPVIFGIQELIF